MHSGIDCGAKALCRSGMIAMTLAGLIPAFAWGQEASLLRQPDAVASRPFTAYDDTLARAADTVLATAAQATHGSAGTADAGMAASGIAGKKRGPFTTRCDHSRGAAGRALRRLAWICCAPLSGPFCGVTECLRI